MSIYNRQLCPGGRPYTIQSGDTLYQIARTFGTTVPFLLQANPGVNPENLRIGQVICIPGVPPPARCPGGTLYTIQPGDTFYRLAQRYSIPLESLLQANRGLNPDQLRVGQEICIPGQAPTPPPQPVAACCEVLGLAQSNLGPDITAGNVMVGPVPRSPDRSAVTFVARGLPAVESLGDFDTYVGTVIGVEDSPQNPERTSIIMSPSSVDAQPQTWSGTAILNRVPQIGDTVEIQPMNLTSGNTGAALLRTTLSRCSG